MQDYLLTLCKYNLWANKRMGDFVRKAGEEKSELHIPSSFHSIRKTMLHIWDGQVVWHYRLHGESIAGWPSQHFNGNLEDIIQGLNHSSEEYVRFMENRSLESVEDPVEYKAMDGTPFFNTVAEIIMHVTNHSTFHRGQIISMLRIAGFEGVGSTDMIRFFREQKG